MRILSRLLRIHLAVFASYLLLSLVVTWPLVTVFTTRFIGHPFGDTYEYVSLIWWLKHALQTGAPLFNQSLLAYPDGLSAVLLWSIPLQSFPSWFFAFILPLPAAFNLSILLTLALNAWAAFYLVSYLTADHPAAWVAGLIFMAYPSFQGQLAAGHIGLLQQWPIPIYVYALFRLRATGERRWIVWGALFFVLSLLGSSVLLIYELFPITLLFALTLILRREWSSFRRLLLTLLVGGLISLIFLIPAALDTLSSAARSSERGDVTFSADLLAIVSPSFQNPLFSVLDYPHRVLGVDPFEKMAYIGIAAGLLALIALWRKPASRWWLALALVAWLGSLGPLLKIFDTPVRLTIETYSTPIALPWLALQNLPLINISRTPARFDFTLALAVAVLAGFGLSSILDQILNRSLDRILARHIDNFFSKRAKSGGSFQPPVYGAGVFRAKLPIYVRKTTTSLSENPQEDAPPLSARETVERFIRVRMSPGTIPSQKVRSRLNLLQLLLLVVVSLAILFEYPFFWTNGVPDMPTLPGLVPAPIAALSAQNNVRAVFDIPWDHPITDKEAMFLQTGHQLPLLAGHIARFTPVDPAKLTLLQQTLDPALMNAAGADIVILHKQWADAAGQTDAFTRAKLGKPLYEDADYAVFSVPKVTLPPAFTALLSGQTNVTDHADAYLYTPSPGWTLLTEDLQADGRDVSVLLNNVRINALHVDNTLLLEVPVFLPQPGYYTLSLTLNPSCPTADATALSCRSVQVSQPALSALQLVPATPPTAFAGGITLNASDIAEQGSTLSAWLDWHFASPITENDIRFVHIVDSSGKLVAQVDSTIGAQPAGSDWSEAVHVPLPADLSPGDYRVYVGWYTYPDTTPIAILTQSPAAQNGLLQIGSFHR